MGDIESRTVPFDADTIVDDAARIQLGTTFLEFPEGPALCTDAISLTLNTIIYGEEQARYVVVTAVGVFDGERLGAMAPMAPRQARSLAASLIKAANLIDAETDG